MRKDQLSRTRRATNFVPLALAFAASCANAGAETRADLSARAGSFSYEIVAEHSHDVASFTQGLAIVEGRLVESSGLYGRSAVTVRDLASGAVLQRRALDGAQFGEGIAWDGARLLQLTWRAGLALAYDLRLNPVATYRYAGEGWGLTHDGSDWLMSDGSDRITRRRGADFRALSAFRVTDRGRPVARLNELEFAGGLLYANVWMTDRIAAIDPASGVVQGWLDLAPLRARFARPAGWNEATHVLNGIAHDRASGHFYVTGKCWPVLYELRVRRGAPGGAPP